jgi:hypothetical protein
MRPSKNLHVNLINQLLPQWQFSERHERLLEGATTAQAFAAILPALSTPDPWIACAIGLREWPGRLLRKVGLSGNALPAKAFGFHSFTMLGQVPDREVVFGLAGRFWQLDYGLRPVADAAAFATLADLPRLVLNISVEPIDHQRIRLVTQTRVHCPTEQDRRRFLPYWTAIRPVSGLIRQRLLRRIAAHSHSTT